ncbi:hypothetical protein B0H13DRAFT_2342446 [Mycena leptocephala]|nr:hypothetical protein B0H13DRAFT_2342446 [Mycena leptocephala]
MYLPRGGVSQELTPVEASRFTASPWVSPRSFSPSSLMVVLPLCPSSASKRSSSASTMLGRTTEWTRLAGGIAHDITPVEATHVSVLPVAPLHSSSIASFLPSLLSRITPFTPLTSPSTPSPRALPPTSPSVLARLCPHILLPIRLRPPSSSPSSASIHTSSSDSIPISSAPAANSISSSKSTPDSIPPSSSSMPSPTSHSPCASPMTSSMNAPVSVAASEFSTTNVDFTRLVGGVSQDFAPLRLQAYHSALLCSPSPMWSFAR